MTKLPAHFEKLRDKLTTEEWFEFNGCFTGDCPHDKAMECANDLVKEGYDAAIADMLTEVVGPALEALKQVIRNSPDILAKKECSRALAEIEGKLK